HEVVDRLREESALRDLFRALSTGTSSPDEITGLARRLALDLNREHLIAVLEAEPEQGSSRARSGDPGGRAWQPVAAQLEGRLTSRFPGALVEVQERSLRTIVPVSGESAAELLERLRSTDWGGNEAPSVGVSNPCAGATSFRRGFEEAAA